VPTGDSEGTKRIAGIGREILRNPATNPYLNFGGKLNIGAGIGDFIGQFATNGNDIRQINWASTAGQLLIGGNVFASSVTASALGSFSNLTIAKGAFLSDASKSSTWLNFGFGSIGNVIAGGIGGQFTKSFGESILGQSVIDGVLNSYIGIGATKASTEVDSKLKK
jgi:hypothetical protein